MASKSDDLYIEHILEASDQIIHYVDGLDWQDFIQDRKTHDACIRQIEIIGEAAKRLSNNCTNAVDLPWKEITGTRDFLIHNYAEVDLRSLWTTIQEDIPVLKERLNNFLIGKTYL
ncbi:TPA: DUF86 domain-containing protein [Candidatus Uhrbacteria bacterium]|uniref:Nucleotidyltransferase n=1 Tax=Candidatus Uhrbacteria bacterium GW2011_GWC2_53_7 TaxID=1618986 RepID=A0A0G1Y0I6_9BACT|nr:MAG: hypothetical protein UY82_C0006G0003 [Candidatus Uhrbacteria bacterium GW2011_GWC2_53_7]OGL72108.1 MAG: hypothetical protein A3D69_03495 [Candidatus Uhrbacteria bacterium RIFCSPHIGHO2_02_FULL_54_11]HBL39588.1 DUF86 domain-containing protein [Candidatus Uhrbacteria bacterium]